MEINNMMQFQSERAKLLRDLQGYKLAALDLALFLDTHPTDKRALAMHKELSKKAEEATQRFQKQFSPLSMSGNQNEDCWDWAKDPWPWQEQ